MTKKIIENLLDLLKLQIEQLKSENQMLKEQNKVILKTLSLHNVEVEYRSDCNNNNVNNNDDIEQAPHVNKRSR